MITTEQIKKLRDETGVSVMQCKKALEEAEGNREKALIILRKKSSDIALKKGNRVLGSGVVVSYLHSTGAVGAMVVLSSETDFVSKNEEFRKLAYTIAMHVAATNPEFLRDSDITEETKRVVKEVFSKEVSNKGESLREKALEEKLSLYFKEKTLMDQLFIKDQSITIGQLIEQAVQKFGENIEISRYVRFSV
jgi:elongation factor Ts